MLRGIAASAVAHAECAVHEGFERKLGTSGVDGADLLEVEFSCQYDLLKAELFKHLGFLGSGDVELR